MRAGWMTGEREPAAPFALVREATRPIPLERFEVLLGQVPGDGPRLVDVAVHGWVISADTLAAVLGRVWAGSPFPDRMLPRRRWRELFALAGFTADGVRADRPAGPVRLFRGSVWERRRDWSWTTHRGLAGHYASGVLGPERPPSTVWTTLAPPGSLLAYNSGEWEFVTDTRGLRVVPAEGE